MTLLVYLTCWFLADSSQLGIQALVICLVLSCYISLSLYEEEERGGGERRGREEGDRERERGKRGWRKREGERDFSGTRAQACNKPESISMNYN